MTVVQVEIPDKTLRDLDALAKRKQISRTQALVEAIKTTKELVDRAPYGATVVPVPRRRARAARRAAD